MNVRQLRKYSLLVKHIALVTMFWAGSASAGIQNELDQMFNSMSNTTTPGAYETARRGVLVGGGLRTRNRIVDTPSMSFRMPSAQGGCGGIDMFAGSFSFINADQFVQMLRSVAANATGYAFQLALSSMCDQCMSHISTLQEKIQKLNEMASNSCQLAQGLVNDTAAAFGKQRQTNDSIMSTVEGIGDVFSSWAPHNNESGKSAREQLNDSNQLEECKDKGNIMWCALQANSVRTFFSYADRGIQEAILSLTGSVIVGDMTNAPDNKGQSPEIRPLPPRADMSLRVLLSGTQGGTASLWRCDDDEYCRNPVPHNVALKGLAAQISEVYTRPGGILDKYRDNEGALTSQEKALIGSTAGTTMGSMVIQLVQKNRDFAATFVNQYSSLIAAAAVNDMLVQMLSAAETALATSKFPEAKQVHELIADAYVRVNREHMALSAEHGSGLDGMTATFNSMMTAMPPAYTGPVAHRAGTAN